MRYNDRVNIVTRISSEDEDVEFEEKVTIDVPCHISGLSQSLNIGIFGKYDGNALAIHLKGTFGKRIDLVEYDGVKRMPTAILSSRKNTVIVISEG